MNKNKSWPLIVPSVTDEVPKRDEPYYGPLVLNVQRVAGSVDKQHC